jgi:hypothetical protein
VGAEVAVTLPAGTVFGPPPNVEPCALARRADEGLAGEEGGVAAIPIVSAPTFSFAGLPQPGQLGEPASFVGG